MKINNMILEISSISWVYIIGILILFILVSIILKSYLHKKASNKELFYFIEKYKLEEMERIDMINKVCHIADIRNEFPPKDFVIANNFIDAIHRKDGEEVMYIKMATLLSTNKIKISPEDIEEFEKTYLNTPKTDKRKLEEIASINSNYTNKEKRIAQEILRNIK